jgi:hypothetical protein
MSDLLQSLKAKTDALEALYVESFSYLSTLRDQLLIFAPSAVIYPPSFYEEGKDDKRAKEEKRVRDAYDLSLSYSAQLAAITVIKDIESSHILGCNSVVVPHLIQEYAKLRSALRAVEACFDKLKQHQHLMVICGEIKSVFEKDKIALFLKDDLIILMREYDFEIDIVDSLNAYKAFGK